MQISGSNEGNRKRAYTGSRFEVRHHDTWRREIEHEERDGALAEQLVASAPRALVGAHTEAGGGQLTCAHQTYGNVQHVMFRTQECHNRMRTLNSYQTLINHNFPETGTGPEIVRMTYSAADALCATSRRN